ncbi:hypothetical protein JCM10212_003214 [Sporobolomyces blumeae]
MAVDPERSSVDTAAPSRISLYHQSSQYRHWRYAKDELDRIRNELNEKAVDRVKKLWDQERAQQATGVKSTAGDAVASASSSSSSTNPTPSSSNPPSAAPTPPPSSNEIEYLTTSDELLLVTYYLTQIQAMCGAFGFPEMVQATSMSYFKRFYLANTCMDYHPKNVMLTCVFLATKTENFPISIDTFSARVKTPPTEILSLEFLVSQSLRFEYKVHHAHLALSGVLLDLQSATTIDPTRIAPAVQKAQQALRTSRHTSLELVYSPSQIALACLRMSDPSLVGEWLGVKTERKTKRDTGKGKGTNGQDRLAADGGTAAEVDTVLEILDEIQEVVRDAQRNPVDKERVKEVDRRLRWARNPEKDPNSALFKKRKLEEEAERDQKEREKNAKRPKNDDSSVFD